VAMEVRDRFPGVRPVVEDEAVTRFFQAEVPGDLGGFEEEMAEEGLVFGAGSGDAGDWFAGDDEEMDGGAGMNIMEGDDLFVLVGDFALDLAIGNFLEEGFAHEKVRTGRVGLSGPGLGVYWTIMPEDLARRSEE
jgi:hypothetical protein